MALCESLALFILGAALLIFLQRRQRYAHWRDIDPSILKNGASAKKLAACGDADYVIVGSGLGGLTSAALLSRAGFECVVLEQHDVAGGSTHTFTEKGFTFDVGVHYVGSVLDRWWSPVRKLVAVTAPGVEWDEVDEVLDAVVNDVTGESFEVRGSAANEISFATPRPGHSRRSFAMEPRRFTKIRRRRPPRTRASRPGPRPRCGAIGVVVS